MTVFPQAIGMAAGLSDVVILCMGLNPSMEGEQGDAHNGDNAGDKRDLELPACQKKLIDAVLSMGKPTVFVNVSGSCVNLETADKSSNAVLKYEYIPHKSLCDFKKVHVKAGKSITVKFD